MRNIWSVAASVAVVVLCGCQNTHVDQVRAGDGMRDWYDDIKSNYPGFRPPRLISPGVSGQTGPAARNNAAQTQTAPADNGEVEALPVDPVPVPEEKPAAAPAPAGNAPEEVKADAQPQAPVEVKKEDAAEAKAEVKADAKSETKKIEPPDPTSGDIYVVQSGDTLGALSKKFYGSVRYVNMLQKANSDIISNANVLKPGMKLIIPKL